MRKIIVLSMMSLDGVIQGPGGPGSTVGMATPIAITHVCCVGDCAGENEHPLPHGSRKISMLEAESTCLPVF